MCAKYVLAKCEQQRRKSACAFTQSDHNRCYSHVCLFTSEFFKSLISLYRVTPGEVLLVLSSIYKQLSTAIRLVNHMQKKQFALLRSTLDRYTRALNLQTGFLMTFTNKKTGVNCCIRKSH